MKASVSGLLLGLCGLVLTGTGCGAGHPVSSGVAASCVGPQITVSPARTVGGSELRIRGYWLSADCNDTGNFGQERPYQNLSIQLQQGARRLTLARGVDAGGVRKSIDLNVKLPRDAAVGRAGIVLLHGREQIAEPTRITIVAAPAAGANPTVDRSTRYATDALTQMVRNSGVSYAFIPATLTAALPSVVYHQSDVAIRASTLVVTGAFTGWKALPAPSNSGKPGASSTTATSHTLSLGFRVGSLVARSREGSRVHVGDVLTTTLHLPVGTDAAKVGRGLEALGPALVFFRGGYPGDGGTWDIAQGSLLGSLDPVGRFTMRVDLMKAKGEDTVGGIVIDATTVAQLKEAGRVARSLPIR